MKVKEESFWKFIVACLKTGNKELAKKLIKQNKNKVMKVFGCRNQYSYGGGLVLVAANTKEEAYLTAAMNEEISYMFDWADDDYMWCEPDGNINHCKSDEYPLDKWFEAEHLSTDLTEPKLIIEDHHSE